MLASMTAPAPSFTAVLFGLSGCLVDFGALARTLGTKESQQIISAEATSQATDYAVATQGAIAVLKSLRQRGIPCAWIEEFPAVIAQALAKPLRGLIEAAPIASNPWPAPDACWQALMSLNVGQLEGSVLVSGDPRLIKSALNAGLWTIGLASCGPLCGTSPAQWEALSTRERETLRTRATLKLYEVGAHSVIDHLGELESCLADIALRRTKTEKP